MDTIGITASAGPAPALYTQLERQLSSLARCQKPEPQANQLEAFYLAAMERTLPLPAQHKHTEQTQYRQRSQQQQQQQIHHYDHNQSGFRPEEAAGSAATARDQRMDSGVKLAQINNRRRLTKSSASEPMNLSPARLARFRPALGSGAPRPSQSQPFVTLQVPRPEPSSAQAPSAGSGGAIATRKPARLCHQPSQAEPQKHQHQHQQADQNQSQSQNQNQNQSNHFQQQDKRTRINQAACFASDLSSSIQFASLHSLSAVATALQRQQLSLAAAAASFGPLAASAGSGPPAASVGQRKPTSATSARTTGRQRRNLRKCRKTYGMDRRSLWCTQCKWKKACSRFFDSRNSSQAH